VSSEDESEPTEWGVSVGRFGSDASAEAGTSGSRDRSRPKRKGSSRSASFGSRRSGAVSGERGGGWSQPKRSQATRGSEEAAAVAEPRSEAEWESLARSVLLRQLALGPRSRYQLEKKLAERDVPAPVVVALLDRFEEVQLIDDAEFARMMVRTRTAAKSLSRASLRRELADKGIDAELTEDALLQITDEDEHAQAQDVVRRKLRSSADLSDGSVREKEVRRLVGVLARKGYNPGAAFSIVKQVLAEAGTQE
jgi:SOS response regulatory protein OraA/RecX